MNAAKQSKSGAALVGDAMSESVGSDASDLSVHWVTVSTASSAESPSQSGPQHLCSRGSRRAAMQLSHGGPVFGACQNPSLRSSRRVVCHCLYTSVEALLGMAVHSLQ
jgi:hypothetical protein